MTELEVETTDNVTIVTMSNPPANLFDRDLMTGLLSAVRGA